VGHPSAGLDLGIVQQNGSLLEIREPRDALAEQHRRQVHPQHVEHPQVQALLRDRWRGRREDLVARNLARERYRLLDASDEVEGHALSRPTLGYRVADDDHRTTDRVLAAPSLGNVEESPSGDQRADLVGGLAQHLGALLVRPVTPVLARGRSFDRTDRVPIEARPFLSAMKPSIDIVMSAMNVLMRTLNSSGHVWHP
jgi:hypothetical protein